MLLLAAQEGDLPTVRAVLEAEGDQVHRLIDDAVTEEGWRALDLACERGHTDVVSELLEHGASPQLFGPNGFTPLMWACRGGHLAVRASLARVRAGPLLARLPMAPLPLARALTAALARAHNRVFVARRLLSASSPTAACSLTRSTRPARRRSRWRVSRATWR